MKIGTWAAALIGGTVMFGLGFLFFGMLLAEFFKSNTVEYAGLAKDPPLVWAIFLLNVAWAWLIAWIIERSSAETNWAEGAKAGAITMFLLGLGMDLDFHAFLNLHKGLLPMLVHIAIVTVMGGVGGAVIALVLNYFNKR